jgi:membrane protease YdiL (CAAX protease family)
MNKIVQFPLVRMLIALVFIGIGIAVGQIVLNLLRSAFSSTNIGIASLLAFVLVTPASYFAYWMYVRYMERRELTELGHEKAIQEFGVGSFIGFALFTLIIVILWLLGFYRVDGLDILWFSLIGALAGAFVSAFAQELIFRGILYRITEEWLGLWWALAVSALLFGLIHLTSAGATIFSALAIALQAGVLLGTTYALTGRLWMAIGLHTMWDFANDGIFGVGVAAQSGESIKGLLQASLSGPILFTGGELGVEASVISLLIVLTAGLILLQRAYRKSQLRNPVFSRMA